MSSVPWLQDADLRIYHGDVLDVLESLPDESVDSVVEAETEEEGWKLE